MVPIIVEVWTLRCAARNGLLPHEKLATEAQLRAAGPCDKAAVHSLVEASLDKRATFIGNMYQRTEIAVPVFTRKGLNTAECYE